MVMKKVLIVIAHPNKNSFSHKISDAYSNESKKNGNKVEVLDLYDKKLKQDFLKFEGRRNLHSEELNVFQKKISESDELVFIFPIWWGYCPAVMKNFFDNNITSGFGYKYIDGKLNKLLKGKSANVFATCDGPGLFYKMFMMPIWKINTLGFCGIKLKSFKVFDKMRLRDEVAREKLLKKVEKISRN